MRFGSSVGIVRIFPRFHSRRHHLPESDDSKSLVENAFSVQFSSDLILPLPDSLQTDENVADTDMHQHLSESCRPSEHRNEKLTALRLACPAAGTTHI